MAGFEKHAQREVQRPYALQLGHDLRPRARVVAHLDRRDRREHRLGLERRQGGQDDLSGFVTEDLPGTLVPEHRVEEGGPEDRGGVAVRGLAGDAEGRIPQVGAGRILTHHPRRAELVVRGEEQVVVARLARAGVEIGPARLGQVAGGAGHGAVRRHLLLEEQRLAEQHLVRGQRVPGRNGDARKAADGLGGDARGEKCNADETGGHGQTRGSELQDSLPFGTGRVGRRELDGRTPPASKHRTTGPVWRPSSALEVASERHGRETWGPHNVLRSPR